MCIRDRGGLIAASLGVLELDNATPGLRSAWLVAAMLLAGALALAPLLHARSTESAVACATVSALSLIHIYFTYLRCWEGVLFFAFVIDVFSRMVVGWQLAANMRTTLVLDALRMALGLRAPGANVELVAHSDMGSQYTSFDYTQDVYKRQGR